MAKPSLCASQQGIQAAKQALTKAGWTQKHLSILVGSSRQPITNFFKGVAIAQPIFVQICDRLNLDWQQIADFSQVTATESDSSSTDSLIDLNVVVQDLRSKIHSSIQEQCGTMRVLDMSHPIGVEDIYTHVNILEQISGHQRKKIAQLLQEYNLKEFDRLGLGKVTQERIPGLEAVQKYHKLIILGKPGAGKTTFLKYLAIQCDRGNFAANCLPIFVTLKDFAEAPDQPSLLQYILGYYAPLIAQNEQRFAIQQIIQHGRALILLDGLDEVRQDDSDRVLKEIRDLSQYHNNHFVMTCRLAAWEYTFEKFTEVEIADFDEQQIAAFAKKWFKEKPTNTQVFVDCLEQNHRIYEMATSPILLTLLCLAFSESGGFPNNRSELYKEGVEALLKKWDAKRGIQRDSIYKYLSHQRKQDLLNHIAFQTFQNQEYFFKQSLVEQLITQYINQLPDTNLNPEISQLDSEAILHSIEAQHGLLVERAKGIYSFSHLSFQEYFTARQLIFNSHNLDTALQELVNHVTDKSWREVFLLATEMLQDASRLLIAMKQKIDQILATVPKLQKFLIYLQERAAADEFSFCKPAAVRAFLFDIDFDIDQNRSVALLLDSSANILVCASFFSRILKVNTLEAGIAIALQYDATVSAPEQKIVSARSANEAMRLAIQIADDSKLLKPNVRKNLASFKQQIKTTQNDEALEQLADNARNLAKKQVQHTQWQFSEDEKKLLREYYYANELLLRCLDSDGCMIERQLRQEIAATLLLPII